MCIHNTHKYVHVYAHIVHASGYLHIDMLRSYVKIRKYTLVYTIILTVSSMRCPYSCLMLARHVCHFVKCIYVYMYILVHIYM